MGSYGAQKANAECPKLAHLSSSALSELQTYWKLSDSLDEGQFSTQSRPNNFAG